MSKVAHSTAGSTFGRPATDLAVLPAGSGEVITDLAVLRDQVEVFGLMASGCGSRG